MTRCALLVRGVNVGGRKLVMAELRTVLLGCGLTDVRTVLNSGNAVFTTGVDPAGLEPELEAALADGLGLRARCLVRTGSELAAVLAVRPFPEQPTTGRGVHVAFVSERPPADVLAAHDPRTVRPGRVVLGERVVYQWCPDGLMAEPDLSAFLLRHWPGTVTVRTWGTVARLAALTAD